MLEIKVKLKEGVQQEFEFIEGKSNWIDLRTAERIKMKQGDFKLIPLGFALELPEGFEAHILPRSSTFKNYGIIQTNSMGIIDNTYSGNEDYWFFPAYALRDTVIEKGDRICQFRIVRQMEVVKVLFVNELQNQNRGGHGSTGVK
ncbi:SPbeta phage deoxyuridine 5'-triphosphate nucleotidohydrolase [Acetoanaerobium sticklandii]|uniref:dUTP diphosphatase n=1 Tax=Acetoanaerobium sticklandii (strain ATCC 12662 / DSM 519 / JCM 1433 / CCUG 9281 / NCIMB 10654 / HF) TaxID=499177 RepID=E3PS55_ACESD|nr:dUTP diphosphatase [Acetoanaerobium sticklandii]CBH21709.1 SPbeta phage deoxyuridine 5'-triphosphate nucleotidohydrolase [Acetoanaerobium sticklandii]